MSRILSTLAATTALALAALTVPMVSARAAAPFDGTWIIDVPADTISGDEGVPTCPALRLQVQITDNQVSGNFRRSAPEESNVVENGGTNAASRVTGDVQPDGALTVQWQNFHATGKLVGDRAKITMQSECGPLMARARRLDEQTTEVTASMDSSAPGPQTATASSGSSETTTNQPDGYNVYFAFDMSKLNPTARGVVDAAVKATQSDQTSRIGLVGKADLSGTDPYNMALSERRADRVRDAMVAGGVPADRIDVRWVGDREPPVPTAAGVRDAQNRVVEVAIR